MGIMEKKTETTISSLGFQLVLVFAGLGAGFHWANGSLGWNVSSVSANPQQEALHLQGSRRCSCSYYELATPFSRVPGRASKHLRIQAKSANS